MPLVSKTFDQLLDFTRTTSGTFVGSNGLIQTTPASVNLLLQTQAFDNAAWVKYEGTVAANAAIAPDGTSTADIFTESTTASTDHRLTYIGASVTVGQMHTLSVYAKANGRNFVSVFSVTENRGKYFSIPSDGTGVVLGDLGLAPTSAEISYVGNGWYRCSITFPATAASQTVRYYPCDTGSTFIYTGNGVSGIAVWGAQLQAVPAANLVLGSELVTNGTFTGGSTTGWTAAGSATISGTGDVLTVTNGATAFGYAVTSITTVIGRTYYVTYQVTGGTSTSNLYIGTASGGFDNYAGPNQSAGSYTVAFVATATTTFLRLGNSVNTSGATSIFDNVSAKEVTAITGMPTTYTRNNGGVFPPRFDYDPVTLAAKGLLIEEQRTNLLLRSEEFDNASWVKSGATVTANATTSPDGTANADKLAETTSTSTHYAINNLVSAVSTIAYTASVYVKAAERTWCILEMGGTPFGCVTWFNLSTGTVGTQSGSPSSVSITAVGNGWWRLTMTKTATAASTVTVGVYPSTGDNVASYAGTAGSGIFVWGAQFEAGAFPTSYIPTVASQVTRTVDQCSIVAPNFAPWYNQSEGSLVFEGSTFKPTTVSPSANVGVEANDGTLNNRNVIQYFNNVASGQTTTAGTVVSSLSQSYVASATDKLAYAYKTNDFAFARNGSLAGTDTSGATPIVDRLALGNYQGQALLNGHIRSVRYYPTRLSNAQLQALTA